MVAFKARRAVFRTMPQLRRNGTTLVYGHETRPDEPAGTVVFVPPLGTGRYPWRWQYEAVAPKYTVLTPHLRGTGGSESSIGPVLEHLPRRVRRPLLSRTDTHSVEELAGDLEAIVCDAGNGDVHLVGAGLGGQIALQYAQTDGRAVSLTLVGTTHGGTDAVPVPAETRTRLQTTAGRTPSRTDTRNRLRATLSDRFTNRNPHLLDRLVEWDREQGADGPTLEAQLSALVGFDITDDLERLRLPTLVIHGSADRVVPVANGRLLAEKLPRSRYVEIDGAGHWCFLERPDRVTTALLSFLDDPEKSVSETRIRRGLWGSAPDVGVSNRHAMETRHVPVSNRQPVQP